MRNLRQDFTNSDITIRCKGTQNASLYIGQNRTRYCRFHHPLDESPVSYIKYNQVSNKACVRFGAEIVAKRNDPRLNMYQYLQLQGWRATTDIQLKTDQDAYV